jgi:hypothetical protein
MKLRLGARAALPWATQSFTHILVSAGANACCKCNCLRTPSGTEPSSVTLRSFCAATSTSIPRSRPHRALTRSARCARTRSSDATHLYFPDVVSRADSRVFVNAALQPVSLTVHRSSVARIASDHFPLIAELVLSRAGRYRGKFFVSANLPARLTSRTSRAV